MGAVRSMNSNRSVHNSFPPIRLLRLPARSRRVKFASTTIKMSRDLLQQAWELLQEAYRAQMQGDYDQAIELYTESLQTFPTAEAHTFLGWTYHFQGKVD